MKQVLYDIVTSIVNNPDKVVIDEKVDGDYANAELYFKDILNYKK